MGQYDLENKDIEQKFVGNHVLPENWNIGLIVGNSGSGKTSIVKNAFPPQLNIEWDQRPIIENFSEKLTMDQITLALGSVGFNSVPYWLKSFSVLSNGEKSRVELARLALERDFVIYDEFTSMVDRDVAKSMANSTQKLFRKLNKKLVAVTCHFDVQNWLLPDWVYDCDKKVFFCPKKQEPKNLFLQSKEQDTQTGNIIKSIII